MLLPWLICNNLYVYRFIVWPTCGCLSVIYTHIVLHYSVVKMGDYRYIRMSFASGKTRFVLFSKESSHEQHV